MLQGALLYSQAERSDPFAYSRAMSHLHNGVSAPFFDGQGKRHDGHYEATEGREKKTLAKGLRFSDGSTEYYSPVYRDVKRP